MMFDRFGPVVILALLALTACGSPGTPAALEDEPGPIVSSGDLAEALRAHGATVEDLGEVPTGIFGVPGRALRVDGQRVDAYPFPDDGAAVAAVPRLTEALALWAVPVRLYRRGALLVLYGVHDPAVSALLEKVLGPPVAGVG